MSAFRRAAEDLENGFSLSMPLGSSINGQKCFKSFKSQIRMTIDKLLAPNEVHCFVESWPSSMGLLPIKRPQLWIKSLDLLDFLTLDKSSGLEKILVISKHSFGSSGYIAPPGRVGRISHSEIDGCLTPDHIAVEKLVLARAEINASKSSRSSEYDYDAMSEMPWPALHHVQSSIIAAAPPSCKKAKF